MPKYKVFNHTADIGYAIFGRTRKELFANSVAALFDLILDHKLDEGKLSPSAIRGILEEKKINIAGNDLEDLLINFLREILYLFYGNKFITDNCEIIKFNNNTLMARLTGESFNNKKHLIKTEIKAVTYSGLTVEKVKAGWRARIIFDV